MIFYENDIVLSTPQLKGKKYSKPLGPNAPHYRNKEERKELARLAQKAGIPVEKLLKNKDIRVKLALAQRKPYASKGMEKTLDLFSKRIKRIAAKELNLPTWSPEIESIAKEYLNFFYKDRLWLLPRYPSYQMVRCVIDNMSAIKGKNAT